MGRVKKDCPVPGCTAKSLVRLPNHLSQVHKLDAKTWIETGQVKSTTAKSALSWSPDAVIDPSKPWWETQSLAPFEPCSSICISGPTGSGKTQWTFEFLKHLNGMYVKDPPKKVLYCYGVYQDLYDVMERTIHNLTMHQGLPSESTIQEFSDEQYGLIILDDLMHSVLCNKEMELLFTQGCHHRRLGVIFITQNLYGQGKCARTIALNTWYMVLFKNVRDAMQISTLGRQLFPGRSGILTEAYKDAVKIPYGYLVLDMSPRANDKMRLRTRVFPGEDPIVYVPKVE